MAVFGFGAIPVGGKLKSTIPLLADDEEGALTRPVSIHLSGEDAKGFFRHSIGDRVQGHFGAAVTSLSQESFDGEVHHSATLTADRLQADGPSNFSEVAALVQNVVQPAPG